MLETLLSQRAEERRGLPVLPGRFPLVGHAPSLYRNATALFRKGRDTLGPLFWVSQGFGLWMVACTGREGFDLLRSKATTNRHFRGGMPALIGESMLGQDGAVHHHMRSSMNAPFAPKGLSAARIGEMSAAMMQERAARWARGGEMTILDETQSLTLDLFFRLIGARVTDLPEWAARYRELVHGAFPIVPRWMPGSPTSRADRARAWLDERIRAILREERENPPEDRFISAIAHGTDDRGKRQSERELIDNVRLLTFAGHETTATALAWIVLTLARRPDLWAELCAEAAGRDIPRAPQELRAFPFAEGLFRETLRFYPPVSFTSRLLCEPVTIHGRTLRAGTHVAVSLGLLLRDPGLYDRPDTFDPHRWMGRREPPSAIELLPFGAGAHFCLGYHLAWLEVVQFAIALARTMAPLGKRPRLAGPEPQHLHLPLGHPTRTASVVFA
jgi:cytochrome P450 monooxygenase